MPEETPSTNHTPTNIVPIINARKRKEKQQERRQLRQLHKNIKRVEELGPIKDATLYLFDLSVLQILATTNDLIVETLEEVLNYKDLGTLKKKLYEALLEIGKMRDSVQWDFKRGEEIKDA